MQKITILFLCIIGQSMPNARSQDSILHFKSSDLRIMERQLIILSDSILRGSSDSVRISSNLQFSEYLGNFLDNQNSFLYSFDSLASVSVLKSRDGLVKIYTWILPAIDKNGYSYFGYIQVLNKKTNMTQCYKLIEKKYTNLDAVRTITGSTNWYGALYYKMVERKIKGKPIYTLLGWHGNNRKSTRKVIDILAVNSDTLIFGKPVFIGEGKPMSRRIFEFTAQAVMKLNFDERKKLIVFDHLSPAPGGEKDQFEFYGTDFRYDAYQFKKGHWVYKKDIDLRNPRSSDAKEGKKSPGKSIYDSAK